MRFLARSPSGGARTAFQEKRETRNGLPSGPTNGSLSKNAVQKVLEVVRIEDRIWARVGTEQWAVVEKRDGTKYAAFTNT
jgi:hypothetical protein